MTKLLRDDMMNLKDGKKYYNSQKEITEKKEYKNTAFPGEVLFFTYIVIYSVL